MNHFTLRQAALACHAKEYSLRCGGLCPYTGQDPSGDGVLTELCTDSREASVGCLFAAIPGERVDGHRFIPMALEKGAAGVLCQREDLAEDPRYQDPRVLYVENTLTAMLQIAASYRRGFSLHLAAVTGSVGKTTTKEMIWTALSARYHTLKSLGNQNNEIGLPRTLLRLDSSYEAAVVEMGMSGLNEIRPLTLAAQPEAVVLTNIGVSHLERLGTRENILKAKLEILEGLKPGGALIVNLDNDLLGEWYRREGKDLPFRLLPYGVESADAAVRAKNVVQSRTDCRFTLCFEGKEYQVELPCVGMHNVENALAAVAVAYAFGIPPQQAAQALKDYQPSGMRQRLHPVDGMLFVEDCYNASPDSMTAALRSMQTIDCPRPDGRKILVFADMLELGSVASQAHHQVGIQAAAAAQQLFAYGPLAQQTVSAAREAGMQCAYWYPDKPQLIEALKGCVRRGDLVWFKASRGMELEQVIDALCREKGDE